MKPDEVAKDNLRARLRLVGANATSGAFSIPVDEASTICKAHSATSLKNLLGGDTDFAVHARKGHPNVVHLTPTGRSKPLGTTPGVAPAAKPQQNAKPAGLEKNPAPVSVKPTQNEVTVATLIKEQLRTRLVQAGGNAPAGAFSITRIEAGKICKGISATIKLKDALGGDKDFEIQTDKGQPEIVRLSLAGRSKLSSAHPAATPQQIAKPAGSAVNPAAVPLRPPPVPRDPTAPLMQPYAPICGSTSIVNSGDIQMLGHRRVGPITSADDASYHEMIRCLSRAAAVAIDCEWSGKQLCLLQLAAAPVPSTEIVVFLVDVASPPGELTNSHAVKMLQPLRGLLEAANLLKIFHDVREDVARLAEVLEDLRLQPVVDTQVAWAVQGLNLAARRAATAADRNGEVAGSSAQACGASGASMARVGLGALLAHYGLEHPKKEEVRTLMNSREGVNIWAERPLSPLLLEYAADDARLLLELWRRMSTQGYPPLQGAPAASCAGAAARCSLVQSLSQLQADLSQLGTVRKSDMLELQSPDLVALSACFGGRPGDQSRVKFEVCYENVKTGKGISYHLLMPNGQQQEQQEEEEHKQQQPQSLELSHEPAMNGSASAPEEPDPDASAVIDLLPESLRAHLQRWRTKTRPQLIEIAIDEARPVVIRLRGGDRLVLEGAPQVAIPDVLASLASVSRKDQDCLFGSDGRMSLPRSLHRISRLQDPRTGYVQGLTLRVGRHVGGVSAIFADILSDLADLKQKRMKSMLLVGAPGLGKTTLLRDVVRALSDDFKMSVVVVDTSNEIAGDGNPPHSCIGSARRMMVGDRDNQHKVLLEAVQNHTPQAVVVDEIGSRPEVAAVRTIAERGVRMVATAHGDDLSSLMSNPELVILLGGVESTTLGDKEAASSNNNKKTRLERKGSPVFDVVIEVVDQGEWRLHRDVGGSVDSLLSGGRADAERRWYGPDGKQMIVSFETSRAAQMAAAAAASRSGTGRRSYADVAGHGGMGANGSVASSWLLELIQSAATLGSAVSA